MPQRNCVRRKKLALLRLYAAFIQHVRANIKQMAGSGGSSARNLKAVLDAVGGPIRDQIRLAAVTLFADASVSAWAQTTTGWEVRGCTARRR